MKRFKRILKYLKYNYDAIWGFAWALIKWGFIIAVFGMAIMAVHYCCQEPSYDGINDLFPYIGYFMLDNAPIVGTLSGFFGIIAAFYCLRPSFHITKALALSNTNQLKVQICNNHYLTSLTDIKVELDFVRYINEGKDARTKRISINKNDLTIIYGRLKGISKCYYTVHTDGGFVWNSRYEYIRCRVAATNNMTGIAKVSELWFTEKEIKYGYFDKDKFVDQSALSITPDYRIVLGKIYQASEPVNNVDYTERIHCVGEALEQIEKLESEELKQLYPSLKEDKDVVVLLKKQLQNLYLFYDNKRRLNPMSFMERQGMIDKIKENTIYLAGQMDKDINQ